MTNFISVPVLSILFISLFSSCGAKHDNEQQQSKGQESEHGHIHIDQLIKKHLILRDEIRDFSSKLQLRDTFYFNAFAPFMIRTDSIIYSVSHDSLLQEVDSFQLTLNDRLFNEYGQVIHVEFRELNQIYQQAGAQLNSYQQHKIDSIWNRIDSLDQMSVSTFAKYYKLDSSTISEFKTLRPTK